MMGMTRYDTIWLVATRTLCAFGVAVACTEWAPSAVAMVFAIGCVLGVTGMTVVHVLGRPVHPRRVIGAAIKAGVVVVATGGLAVPFGLAILLLLLIVALFSPPVAAWLRYRRLSAATSDAVGSPLSADVDGPLGEEPGALEDLGDLSDRQLCRAWRKSYFDLTRSRSLPASLRIVQARQEYLDELERRSPHGLSAWLTSGARAAGDPSRYIAGSGWIRRPRSA
jgi:hypothetical protein